MTVPMARDVARDYSILVSRTELRMPKEEKAVDLRYSARHYSMGFFIRICHMAMKRSVIRSMETF